MAFGSILFHFHHVLLLHFNFYLFFLLFCFLFASGGGGVGVASNFVICVYMLTLQFHPVLVTSSEISPLHLTPHLQKSVI